MLNPLANGKVQGHFKAFECFSRTVQGNFYFQGLFKSPVYSSTFQACANTGPSLDLKKKNHLNSFQNPQDLETSKYCDAPL